MSVLRIAEETFHAERQERRKQPNDRTMLQTFCDGESSMPTPLSCPMPSLNEERPNGRTGTSLLHWHDRMIRLPTSDVCLDHPGIHGAGCLIRQGSGT